MKAQNRVVRFAFAAAFILGSLAISKNAHAFCGFYVSSANGELTSDATQVVLMRDRARTVLSIQNQYIGPVQDFALVVPVPVVLQKENVKTLPRDVLERVDRLGAPRLVESWEQDPCAPSTIDRDTGGAEASRKRGSGTGLGHLGGVSEVTIESNFSVGEYNILILSAKDSSALDTWLRQNNYKIPAGAEAALRPYVAEGSKFFVAKVDVSKVHFVDDTTSSIPNAKRAELSPLRFYYDSDTFSLPVRLGLLNSNGAQDLIVSILSPASQRYVVANMPNVTIPTNLVVNDTTREAFPAFYASLFDKTLEKNPGSVVTEYAWGTGTCDPCPSGVSGLVENDLATLGADVLPGATFGPPKNTVTIRQGQVQVIGKLPAEIVQRLVRRNFGHVRACYDQGRQSHPSLTGGTLNLKLVIDSNGNVTSAQEAPGTGAKFPDAQVSACIVKSYSNTSFPKPEFGNVSVIYPFILSSPPLGPDGGVLDVLQSVPRDFVLTRLHTRYGKNSLGGDLVFQKAPPLSGGRESYGNGELQTGASLADVNDFQARYVIRHPFKGAITCQDPHRGVWGSPPLGTDLPDPVSATKLGITKRGADYASFLVSGVVTFDPMPTAMVITTAPNDASVSASGSSIPSLSGAPSKGLCSFSESSRDSENRSASILASVAILLAIARRRARES